MQLRIDPRRASAVGPATVRCAGLGMPSPLPAAAVEEDQDLAGSFVEGELSVENVVEVRALSRHEEAQVHREALRHTFIEAYTMT